MESVLGPDGVADLKRATEDHKRSREKVQKTIPQVINDPQYYRGQCEFTDALIKLLKISLNDMD